MEKRKGWDEEGNSLFAVRGGLRGEKEVLSFSEPLNQMQGRGYFQRGFANSQLSEKKDRRQRGGIWLGIRGGKNH